MSYESFFDLESTAESQELWKGVKEIEPGLTLERSEQAVLSPSELTEGAEFIAGNPETDMESWHEQAEQNSCAVCCQEFVAEQLLDREFSEQELIHMATERGWYDPETGTTLGDVGNLLEELGLEVERESGLTLPDLFHELESGHKLICAVNNMVLEDPGFADLPGINANHAVQVIGIDYSNPEGVRVILNDSGVSYGMGREVSADTFVKAWNTSGNFAVSAWKGAN